MPFFFLIIIKNTVKLLKVDNFYLIKEQGMLNDRTHIYQRQ